MGPWQRNKTTDVIHKIKYFLLFVYRACNRGAFAAADRRIALNWHFIEASPSFVLIIMTYIISIYIIYLLVFAKFVANECDSVIC